MHHGHGLQESAIRGEKREFTMNQRQLVIGVKSTKIALAKSNLMKLIHLQFARSLWIEVFGFYRQQRAM